MVEKRSELSKKVEKLHARCNLCLGQFQLQRGTNAAALALHEQSSKRKKAVQAAALSQESVVACVQPAVQPARRLGVNVLDARWVPEVSFCGKLRQEFSELARLGFPDINSSRRVHGRLADDGALLFQRPKCASDGNLCLVEQPHCNWCAKLTHCGVGAAISMCSRVDDSFHAASGSS